VLVIKLSIHLFVK